MKSVGSSTCRVLPLVALLFLCSFLDRTNVGNAKIIGLEEDLGITDLQYTQGLAVFYATYIARLALLVPRALATVQLTCGAPAASCRATWS